MKANQGLSRVETTMGINYKGALGNLLEGMKIFYIDLSGGYNINAYIYQNSLNCVYT